MTPGTKLGPYEIISPLGAGGMGEVYRARDTRLDRTVAIKILAAHLSASPELKQRFEREARTISSLSHPHICHLYDVGAQDGTDYLVMEFLEGETLAERLRKGPLPLNELLKIGIEVAEALQVAHRADIIHRDLKPGNIMLTKSGAKLMDFGLAKPANLGAAASGTAPLLSAARTSSGPSPLSPLTSAGSIVGTIQYMSPEQIEGKEADARSDIFAFGAVLYEMATGKRAFEGKSQLSVASAILEKNPEPISAMKPLTPASFEHVVQRALEKSPDDRWQAASDIRGELKWVAEGGSQVAIAAPVQSPRGFKQKLAWIVAGAAALLAIVLAVAFFMRPGKVELPLRASLIPPADSSYDPFGFGISPDGSKMMFVAVAKDGKRSLWVRSLNSLVAQQLTGTEDAQFPFWSPDSKAIGFFAGGKLKKIDAAGGPVLTLADAESGRGGTWNAEGAIVFSPKSQDDGLYQVSASGGTVSEAAHFEKERGEDSYRWPFFLPDGRHFIFFMSSKQSAGGGSNPNDKVAGTYLIDLKTGKKDRLLNSDSGAQYANGYLFYLQQRNLMAQRFDASTGKLLGAALPLAERVQYDPQRWVAASSVSGSGLLAYLTGDAIPTQLVWYSREGKEGGKIVTDGATQEVELSPDGSKVATRVTPPNGNSDVWVYDLARGIGTRLTYEPSFEGYPVWERDGKRVFYTTDRKSNQDIYSKASSGLGAEEVVLESPNAKSANDWSPDGRTLVYMNFPGPVPQLWVHEIGTGTKDHPLLGRKFAEANAQFSPDGHWLAYQSDESGTVEIYAISYPNLATKVQISANGGVQVRWRRDGKEIFYVAPDSRMMAVSVQSQGDNLIVGTPRGLFDTKIAAVQRTPHQYAVSADGQKFLINTRPESSAEPITLYANWGAELKK